MPCLNEKVSTGVNNIFISGNITNWKWFFFFWMSSLFISVVVAKGDTVPVSLAY